MALTGSVYASSGYIENHSVLGVMSRRKYHFSYSRDDDHVGYKDSNIPLKIFLENWVGMALC